MKGYTIDAVEIQKVLDAYLDMSVQERSTLKDKLESSYMGNHSDFAIAFDSIDVW